MCNHNFTSKDTTLRKSKKINLVNPGRVDFFCIVCQRSYYYIIGENVLKESFESDKSSS